MVNNQSLHSQFVPRSRKVRILATLGPASNSPEMIRKLAEAERREDPDLAAARHELAVERLVIHH